ncbi:MAG: alpha/beta fold hydrolase [Shewanella fodinae]|nr:alpha/beta fold hydrolase [Shewanella fodinae]
MSRVEPLSRQWLDVGDGHLLHLLQYGNPDGIPLLFLHGGPGSGCHTSDLALFDLQRFRMLLLDQRGAGLSQPSARLAYNDVLHLLTDIERLRHWLGLERWCLAGGSFGATLGLIYSGLCPQRVLAQCYWGVFVPSTAGRSWLYGSQGAPNVSLLITVAGGIASVAQVKLNYCKLMRRRYKPKNVQLLPGVVGNEFWRILGHYYLQTIQLPTAVVH